MSKKENKVSRSVRKYHTWDNNPHGEWCWTYYLNEDPIFCESGDPEVMNPRGYVVEEAIVVEPNENGTYEVKLHTTSGSSYDWHFQIRDGKVCELHGKTLSNITNRWIEDRFENLRDSEVRAIQVNISEMDYLFSEPDGTHLGWTPMEWDGACEKEVVRLLQEREPEQFKKLESRLRNQAEGESEWISDQQDPELYGTPIFESPNPETV